MCGDVGILDFDMTTLNREGITRLLCDLPRTALETTHVLSQSFHQSQTRTHHVCGVMHWDHALQYSGQPSIS